MKKLIILTLSVLLVLAAACGEAETTGEVVKDTGTTSPSTSSCGDGECTEAEMCNINTLKSGCPEDCGECPGVLYAKGFDCRSGACRETSDNTFEISGDSSIELEIVNLGEVLANTLEIDSFKCYVNNQKVMSNYLLANYKGYILEAKGFDGAGEREVRLKARGTHGDKATYVLGFEVDPKSTKETLFDLECRFEIKTHSPMTGKEQTVQLSFK